jgi:hypothetical protein
MSEFNLAALAIGAGFGVVMIAVVFVCASYANFKEEVRKSMEYWER